jgi:CobQ-like glutamine amidotransferase family enzyme/UDP-N-acetylmuramyl tripeptide synthase
LALEPKALERFSTGRQVVLVSGTNGKTTTTKFLASALGALGAGEVVTNVAGANLRTGLAVALAKGRPGAPAVLEVDEAWLASVAAEVRPSVIVLLNLSRDQLDRNNEVRQVAERWRVATAELGEGALVVANADDPLVAWAAMAAPRTAWVGAGLEWRGDATGCPRCGGRLCFGNGQAWRCSSCALARPEPVLWLEPRGEGRWSAAALSGSHEIDLQLPGRANAANAVMALAALRELVGKVPGGPKSSLAEAPGGGKVPLAEVLGDPKTSLGEEDVAGIALRAMAAVQEVAGRYAVLEWCGATGLGPTSAPARARLLLAKNPAGWAEVFAMLAPAPSPVVVAINARTADGRDPSWLWDVPFERLKGRSVVATGERCADLGVRLHYAEVGHITEPDPLRALAKAGPGSADVVANYTAFHQVLTALRARAVRSQRLKVLPGRAVGQRAPAGPSRLPADAALSPEDPSHAPATPSGAAAPTAPLTDGHGLAGRRQAGETVTIALVYPDLLGTYGDAGNATVLAQRLRWRGIPAEVLTVSPADAVPEGCQIYVVGGGEDLPQVLAAQMLRESRALHRAVQKGAVVLAVCAGLQVLGESFPAPGAGVQASGDGGHRKDQTEGLGLLPCVTYRTSTPRAIGEVLVRASGRWSHLGLLTGFENHASVTELLPGAEPAGTVLAGTGNKDGTWEGVVYGRVWGTYLHGPVLARNPMLADFLLSWAVGELCALDDSEPAALHAERSSRGPGERGLQQALRGRRWERSRG